MSRFPTGYQGQRHMVVEIVDAEIVEDQPNDQAKNTMETIL